MKILSSILRVSFIVTLLLMLPDRSKSCQPPECYTPCTYPHPSADTRHSNRRDPRRDRRKQSFRDNCSTTYLGVDYICDPGALISRTESSVLDHVVTRSFVPCDCQNQQNRKYVGSSARRRTTVNQQKESETQCRVAVEVGGKRKISIALVAEASLQALNHQGQWTYCPTYIPTIRSNEIREREWVFARELRRQMCPDADVFLVAIFGWHQVSGYQPKILTVLSDKLLQRRPREFNKNSKKPKAASLKNSKYNGPSFSSSAPKFSSSKLSKKDFNTANRRNNDDYPNAAYFYSLPLIQPFTPDNKATATDKRVDLQNRRRNHRQRSNNNNNAKFAAFDNTHHEQIRRKYLKMSSLATSTVAETTSFFYTLLNYTQQIVTTLKDLPTIPESTKQEKPGHQIPGWALVLCLSLIGLSFLFVIIGNYISSHPPRKFSNRDPGNQAGNSIRQANKRWGIGGGGGPKDPSGQGSGVKGTSTFSKNMMFRQFTRSKTNNPNVHDPSKRTINNAVI